MNIPESIKSKYGNDFVRLYKRRNHPIEIVKTMIYGHFPEFDKIEDLSPVVSTKENFDDLLIPTDHPSRSHSDTYYLSENRVLRTHTSAHQSSLLRFGKEKFIVTGDVYRRDEVDRYHYPVFHQMEGVCLVDDPEENLKSRMAGLVKGLFGLINYRFVNSYFSFTNPSWELEIKWKGAWLEVAGMGVIHPDILRSCGIEKTGWAFGLGLERVAMLIFDIPDIRLFWSEDRRFLDQFGGRRKKFVPYSKYPLCYKDIAFWTDDNYNHNDFYELVREIGGDIIESVRIFDSFKKDGFGVSYCYRVSYRSMDRTLTNAEVDEVQKKIRDSVLLLGVRLR